MKNKTRHTPGPWKFDYCPEVAWAETSLTNNSHDVIMTAHGRSLELRVADAALIAAAPEMLEALEQAVYEMENPEGDYLDINYFQDIIKKAKGGPQ